MEARLAHFINTLLDWFNAIPGHSWYAFGVVLASVPVVIGITQWIKSHHFKVNAVELENHFIALNVVVWSSIMTVADFVLTNGDHFSTFFPFLKTVMPVLTAAAPIAYTFAKAAHNAFINSEKEDQKQRLSTVLAAADSVINKPGYAPLSNGTASNNVSVPQTQTVPKPQPNLLQL